MVGYGGVFLEARRMRHVLGCVWVSMCVWAKVEQSVVDSSKLCRVGRDPVARPPASHQDPVVNSTEYKEGSGEWDAG